MGREGDCVWFVALNWGQALHNGDHKNYNTHTEYASQRDVVCACAWQNET
jgi:hypothetical protein